MRTGQQNLAVECPCDKFVSHVDVRLKKSIVIFDSFLQRRKRTHSNLRFSAAFIKERYRGRDIPFINVINFKIFYFLIDENK